MANALIGRLMGVVVAATMFVPAADAQVLSQARARLQDLTYEIYDAKPDDGIAVQALFLDEVNAWRTQLGIEVYRDDDDAPFSYYSNEAYESLEYKSALDYAGHQAPLSPFVASVGVYSAEGHGAAGGAWTSALPMVGAQGQSLESGVSFSAISGYSTTGTGNISPTFYNLVLGPGTGVRISGYGVAEVWLSQEGSWASSYVELFARFSPRAVDGSFQSQLQTSRYEAIGTDIDREAAEFLLPHDTLVKRMEQRSMSLSYENLSDQEQIGRVRFAAWADGESLSPVPEPNVWALMLIGLLSLLLWLRRHATQPGAM